MRTGLGIDDLGDLLERPLIAVLATRRADDSVMLSPVWFEWHEGGINIWVPTPEGGNLVLRVSTRDAAKFAFAADNTRLWFVLRPAAGAKKTPKTVANSDNLTSRRSR